MISRNKSHYIPHILISLLSVKTLNSKKSQEHDVMGQLSEFLVAAEIFSP